MTIPISQFITDPALLGGDFASSSWDAWRITLKAAFAEPMTEAERARFREMAERDPPARRVRELWLAIGRRGGKDSTAAAVATYAACCGNFQAHLRRGERAVILCLAVDRDQAQIVFSYIRANFEDTPLLRSMLVSATADTLELSNGVSIVVATNSFRGIRGRTVALAILDECSYWRSDQSSNPDVEVYSALLPGLATLRAAGSMIVGISTVYRRSGLLFEKWQKYHGKSDDGVLVIRQPSAVYNPTLSEPALAAEIAADIELDPERGAAEWLSEWRSDLADFVSRAAVEAAVIPGRLELPYIEGNHYTAFVDPSGAAVDAMTLSIGHFDKAERAILDLIREIRPPFSPESVVAEFAHTCKQFRIGTVTGDRWGGEFAREPFRKLGIDYCVSEKTKSEIYLAFLPLLNSGRVELLDNPRLFSQLVHLERRTGRGSGHDVVDHPRGAHDDIVNSAAGALTLAALEPGPLRISAEALARARAAPRRVGHGGYRDPLHAFQTGRSRW
jgi:hypothetical protein